MKTCNPEETGTQQLIFPPNSRPSNFEEGIELGSDQERQRLAAYFHDQLATVQFNFYDAFYALEIQHPL